MGMTRLGLFGVQVCWKQAALIGCLYSWAGPIQGTSHCGDHSPLPGEMASGGQGRGDGIRPRGRDGGLVGE
ncbi:hypothetical protein NDU88_002263 [Pleurodeles waltl]|uniref:Uncharacterized protein n=1 Tax=Pleurodeles waltl TaxID=8319 RepID=A0AAV7L0T0_PLEWA|nr:hypothetical protein NDU88_002263 [Pleurodeles waltl]